MSADPRWESIHTLMAHPSSNPAPHQIDAVTGLWAILLVLIRLATGFTPLFHAGVALGLFSVPQIWTPDSRSVVKGLQYIACGRAIDQTHFTCQSHSAIVLTPHTLPPSLALPSIQPQQFGRRRKYQALSYKLSPTSVASLGGRSVGSADLH